MRLVIQLVCLILFFPLKVIQQTQEKDKKDAKASFYHDSLHGLITSSGENYDRDDFTAAHRTLPFHTIVLVTNKNNNRSVVVRINDRGPFVRNRAIDLSRSAAKKLGMIKYGVVPVRISELKFLNSYPLNDSLLKNHDVWDCFGNKSELKDKSVYVWRTDDWKHAFYMASSLSIDHSGEFLVIMISEENAVRNYYLLFTGIQTDEKANGLIELLRKDGFSRARIFSEK